MRNDDKRTVKLQHLWNNQKLFDWGNEGDVDENKNAFVEDKVKKEKDRYVKDKKDRYVEEEKDRYVKEEKDRYVEEEKDNDVRKVESDVGKDGEKEDDVREGDVNENKSEKEQQYDVIFLHIALILMMAVKISEMALKIYGTIHYIINLWCTIMKYVKKVQAAIQNEVKDMKKVHMKEKYTVYQKVRQDATITNSGSVTDQTETSIEETPGWIQEKVSGRKESCKTIFQNNKILMYDLRWCKLSEAAEKGDKKVKEDDDNIMYIIPSMYKV